MFRFDYIKYTGLTEAEVLTRAQELFEEINQRFPGCGYWLQEAIDSVIDSAIEYNQGARA